MRRARNVRSPDGLHWKVGVYRFRLPTWQQSQYDPSDDGNADPFMMVVEYVFVAPILWFLLPLCRMIVELPVAAVRSLGSDNRWIQAKTIWPAENVILWRVDRAGADAALEHIAAHLGKGYESLTPGGAEIVSMTPPPGLKDLDD